MKNISLLIDLNVILDYLLVRQPQFSDSVRIISACQNEAVKGYIAFHSLPSMWYVLRKQDINWRRAAFEELTNFLEVVAVPHSEVVRAIKNENFSDFEDCLQEKCAAVARADFIVTSNVKDFQASTIPAVTPAQMLEIFLRGSKNES